MRVLESPTGRRIVFAVVALFAGLGMSTGSATAAAPFNALDGWWAGGGRATFEGGKTERLRCTASYKGSSSGNRLSFSIRCASSSTNTDLRATLTHSAGSISGNWEERTYNVGGEASGKSTSNSLRIRFGGGASGTLSVAVSKSSQAVSISLHGGSLQGISLNLTRRR